MTDPWIDRSFAVLDLETSGRDVIEVGVVRWAPWRTRATFERLCRPLRPIPPGCVHGITDGMVAGEPSFVRVLPELLEFLGEAVIVAHNAPFDRAFLRESLARAGRGPLANPFLDTLRLSRRFFPDAPAHDLATLCWFHRIPRARAHRALDDALATVEVLRLALECARDEGIRETGDLLATGAPATEAGRAAPPAIVIDSDEQSLLEAAVVRGDELEIRTRSELGRERTRRVVPYVIDRARGIPRLVAYDVEKGETKVIRLDRVVSVAEAGR